MDDINNIIANIENLTTEQNILIQRQFQLINRQQSALDELRELVQHELEHAYLAGRYPPPDLNSSGQEEEEDLPSESDEEEPEAGTSARVAASSRTTTVEPVTSAAGLPTTVTLTRVRQATRSEAATLAPVASSRAAATEPTTPTGTASVLEVITTTVRPPVFHINDKVKFGRGRTTAAGEGIVIGFTADNPPGLKIRRINRKGGRCGSGQPGDPVTRGPFNCTLLSREGS